MKSFKKRGTIALALAALAAMLTVAAATATAGGLDTTFGAGGKVITDFGSHYDRGYAVAIQADGKIIVAGEATVNGQYDIGLARYNRNGSLDQTFGSGGKVTTDIGNDSNWAFSVALQPDGKIVVAGNYTISADHYGNALARYNSDGSLDQTFGRGGKVTDRIESLYYAPRAVALQSDGRIILASSFHTGITATLNFILTRYTVNGARDSSFGAGGWASTYFGADMSGQMSGIAIQPDDKIIAVGEGWDGSRGYFALARFTSDGGLDDTFGEGDGTAFTSIGNMQDRALAVAIQPDGKFLVSGTSPDLDSACGRGDHDIAALARYNSNGTLDASFGSSGIVKTSFGQDKDDWGNAIALQSDGKIIVAGNSSPCNYFYKADFALARYQPNGVLDTTFGIAGKITTDFGNGQDLGQGVLIQPDRKIVLTGVSFQGNKSYIALARYQADSLRMAFASIGAQDGWVLESSETSNVGGAVNSDAAILRLGDNAAKKQYRGILSFNTGASLPDNAVITGVILKVKQQAILGGGNPVAAFGGFMVDIKKGFFGTAPTLQASDFQAAANQSYGPFNAALFGGWYSINLTGAKTEINKLTTGSGLTQIRLRFNLDDNNNAVANYLSLYSGNAAAADRPQLVITYYVP